MTNSFTIKTQDVWYSCDILISVWSCHGKRKGHRRVEQLLKKSGRFCSLTLIMKRDYLCPLHECVFLRRDFNGRQGIQMIPFWPKFENLYVNHIDESLRTRRNLFYYRFQNDTSAFRYTYIFTYDSFPDCTRKNMSHREYQTLKCGTQTPKTEPRLAERG
jgi:hypothetical protein